MSLFLNLIFLFFNAYVELWVSRFWYLIQFLDLNNDFLHEQIILLLSRDFLLRICAIFLFQVTCFFAVAMYPSYTCDLLSLNNGVWYLCMRMKRFRVGISRLIKCEPGSRSKTANLCCHVSFFLGLPSSPLLFSTLIAFLGSVLHHFSHLLFFFWMTEFNLCNFYFQFRNKNKRVVHECMCERAMETERGKPHDVCVIYMHFPVRGK